MTRHLVELGVSIQVWRNQWGQVVIDLKCPEAEPEIRLNNKVAPNPPKDAPALLERTFGTRMQGDSD